MNTICFHILLTILLIFTTSFKLITIVISYFTNVTCGVVFFCTWINTGTRLYWTLVVRWSYWSHWKMWYCPFCTTQQEDCLSWCDFFDFYVYTFGTDVDTPINTDLSGSSIVVCILYSGKVCLTDDNHQIDVLPFWNQISSPPCKDNCLVCLNLQRYYPMI